MPARHTIGRTPTSQQPTFIERLSPEPHQPDLSGVRRAQDLDICRSQVDFPRHGNDKPRPGGSASTGDGWRGVGDVTGLIGDTC